MASVSRMFAKNLLPSPSPFDAPLTRPAMSTISTVAGTMRCGLTIAASLFKRSSGTLITPTFGSIVQKGKFADCALAFDKQLKRVDLPTLGSPTIPHCKAIYYILFIFESFCKDSAKVRKNCRLPYLFARESVDEAAWGDVVDVHASAQGISLQGVVGAECHIETVDNLM